MFGAPWRQLPAEKWRHDRKPGRFIHFGDFSFLSFLALLTLCSYIN